MKKSIFALVLIMSVAFVAPAVTKAATVPELQAQLNELLQLVHNLQTQIAALHALQNQPPPSSGTPSLSTNPPVTATNPDDAALCTRITRLRRLNRYFKSGDRENNITDIGDLQDALERLGNPIAHLNDNRGIFGPLTQEALLRFQREHFGPNRHTGIAGPITFAEFSRLLGCSSSNLGTSSSGAGTPPPSPTPGAFSNSTGSSGSGNWMPIIHTPDGIVHKGQPYNVTWVPETGVTSYSVYLAGGLLSNAQTVNLGVVPASYGVFVLTVPNDVPEGSGYVLQLNGNPASTGAGGNSAQFTIGPAGTYSGPAGGGTPGNFTTSSLPTVSVTAPDATAAETSPGVLHDTATFRFSRTGSTASALQVQLAFSGSAVNGQDINSLNQQGSNQNAGYVIIQAGQSSADLDVVPIDDTLVEGTEAFTVTIAPNIPQNPSYNIGTPSSATVTILDNDAGINTSLPTVTVAATDATAAEGTPVDTGTVTVTRTGNGTLPILVFYVISGTASNGSDYATIPTSVIIPSNQTSATVIIAPIADTTSEPNETVILTLSPQLAAYTVGSANSATVTISDSGTTVPPPPTVLPTVTITASTPTTAEASGPAGAFAITRTGSTASGLNVSITISGTASNGVDYTAVPLTITIPAGQSSVTSTIVPIDDTAVEGDETVIFTISPQPTAYIVGSPNTATVTVSDNDGTSPPPPPPSFSLTITNPTVSTVWAGESTRIVLWTGGSAIPSQYVIIIARRVIAPNQYSNLINLGSVYSNHGYYHFGSLPSLSGGQYQVAIFAQGTLSGSSLTLGPQLSAWTGQFLVTNQ